MTEKLIDDRAAPGQAAARLPEIQKSAVSFLLTGSAPLGPERGSLEFPIPATPTGFAEPI